LRAKLDLIESENERLKGELERRPPVLATQLSLLPTDSQLIPTDEMAVENEFVTSPDDSDLKSDTQAGQVQKVLTLATAKSSSKSKKSSFKRKPKAIAVVSYSRAELEGMKIRELKDIASGKVKNFSRMRSAQLIEELMKFFFPNGENQ
jgi:hypothetical protein